MTIKALFTLAFWNGLARAHLPELVMVLAAAVVVLLDRPIRRLVHRATRRYHGALRFLVFLAVCSFGYAALTLACAWLLKSALAINRGQLMAPLALAVLIIVGIVAERQKQM